MREGWGRRWRRGGAGRGEGRVGERVKGERRGRARREGVNLGKARTESEHVKERRAEREEGERQRKDRRGESIGESRESGLLRGGLTSPRLFSLAALFFQSFMSGISLHFFRDILACRCPCIGALPSFRCLLRLPPSQSLRWQLQE